MGTYLNSITPYTLYKSESLSPHFVDKTLMLRELFPYVSAGNRHICITRPRRFGKTIMANMISSVKFLIVLQYHRWMTIEDIKINIMSFA